MAGIALVAVLGLAIHALGNGPLVIDSWWHDLMLTWRTEVGLALARALDLIGGVLSMIIIGIGVVIAFIVRGRPWAALTVVVALLVSEALTGVLKLTLARPRPADSLANDAMTSFPSGHTSAAAVTAIVLALLIRDRLAWMLAVTWVVLMAWSRTYLAAHWLTDVIGGALLGASVALLVWASISPAERDPVPSAYGFPGGETPRSRGHSSARSARWDSWVLRVAMRTANPISEHTMPATAAIAPSPANGSSTDASDALPAYPAIMKTNPSVKP